jgi:peptide-methionine (S)-S-oxide reductase
LYHNDYQKKIAEESKLDISKQFIKPIVTQIAPFSVFFVAEEYHQDFYRKNPDYGYCRAVIKPKLDKLQPVLNQKQN